MSVANVIAQHAVPSCKLRTGFRFSDIKKIALLLFIFSSLPFQPARSQDSSHPNLYVDRVVIVGNEHTKDFVILREMTLKPGMLITQQQLEYDKNRIYSLGLFNEVQLQVIPFSDSNATIVVQVTERWYIYPYPIFGVKDRDWGKLYYGLGLLHMNFRGRNEKLIASFAVGYDPWLMLNYRNPFLTEEGNYFLDAHLGTNKIRNKSLQAITLSNGTTLDNFDERHYNANVSVGKRIGIQHTAWISAGYEVIDVEPYYAGTTISSNAEDKYPILSIGYSYDTRDVREFANNGTYFSVSISKFGLLSNEVDVIRYDADARRYVPITSSIVVAGRVFGDFAAAGPTPSYNRVYFGYGERIRGHFKEVHEGENRVGATAEFHYTLMPPQYFTIDDLPPAFGVWRFGIVAAAFADAGTVWFRGQPLALDNFIKGYGVGLDFLLPYSAVLRVEYALNEIRQGEFILDLGSSF